MAETTAPLCSLSHLYATWRASQYLGTLDRRELQDLPTAVSGYPRSTGMPTISVQISHGVEDCSC